MTFTRIFVLERKFAYARGAQAAFLGVQVSKCALVARACYFILVHNFRLGSTILAWSGMHKQ